MQNSILGILQSILGIIRHIIYQSKALNETHTMVRSEDRKDACQSIFLRYLLHYTPPWRVKRLANDKMQISESDDGEKQMKI